MILSLSRIDGTRRDTLTKYPIPSPTAQASCHVLSLDSGPRADHRPMDGRFLLLVLGFAPLSFVLFSRLRLHVRKPVSYSQLSSSE
eukprot:scaffold16768_cov117-Isochrysis_galbana.AAC.5